MKKFHVAPFDQHLTCNGRDLNDNQATLASLRIFPGSVIVLQVIRSDYFNRWIHLEFFETIVLALYPGGLGALGFQSFGITFFLCLDSRFNQLNKWAETQVVVGTFDKCLKKKKKKKHDTHQKHGFDARNKKGERGKKQKTRTS